MKLHEDARTLGPPWRDELQGRVDLLTVESDLLAGNPLGDAPIRPLSVYVPPHADGAPRDSLPSIYVLQGFAGRGDQWLNRHSFEPTLAQRLDKLFTATDCPPALIVLVDAWTAYGGSQFVNSVATGRYMDYLCDEIVPFVDSHYDCAAAGRHGAIGKSSGGYGALVNGMRRPDVFAAIAAIAPDALFEASVARSFAPVARILRDHFEGSYDVFLAQLPDVDPFRFGVHGAALELYAYAACYTPDPQRPGRALLPFDVRTGRLCDDVWASWLTDHDPVRLVARHADALSGMRAICIHAGRRDEYHLDLAARAIADELQGAGIEHDFALFDGGHGGNTPRMVELIAALAGALSR